MRRFDLIRYAVVAVCSSAVAVSGFAVRAGAQTAAQKPFEPHSGQPGKDVVWVPTPQPLVEKMLDMAKVTPDDFVIDLGSGDGRTVITAAKRGATRARHRVQPGHGRALQAQRRRRRASRRRPRSLKADMFETDFSKATVITMFLLPTINMKLRPKILDLKPGTRIVSNSFTMDDWQADERGHDQRRLHRLVHRAALDRAGQGRGHLEGHGGGTSSNLTLKQEFQNLTGSLEASPISDGKMKGEEIDVHRRPVEVHRQGDRQLDERADRRRRRRFLVRDEVSRLRCQKRRPH